MCTAVAWVINPHTHDDSTYIGRGLSQCTGKDGYLAVKKITGLDVISNPTLLCAPGWALECGVADFIECGCLPFAEKGDVVNVTKKLNGGLIGLAERERWTSIWKSRNLDYENTVSRIHSGCHSPSGSRTGGNRSGPYRCMGNLNASCWPSGAHCPKW